jgi:hypothetical protein
LSRRIDRLRNLSPARIEFFPVATVKYYTASAHRPPPRSCYRLEFLHTMALVSITEAAKLVRRNRSTIYRDIEKGRLSKTVTPEGETQIETSELLRTYGRLHTGERDLPGEGPVSERIRIAMLEERTRSLERALALEGELRKVKDQVTNELRARLADKDSVIKVLESKVLFLEYDKQVESLEPEDGKENKGSNDSRNQPRKPNAAEDRMPKKGWWARLLRRW